MTTKTNKEAEKKGGRAVSENDAWDGFGEKEEKPRENLPVLNQAQKDRKRVLKYVKTAAYTWPALAVLAILMGFTSFTASLDGDSPAGESSTQTLTPDEALQRSLAVETVTEWLSTSPSPLPRGRVLAWDGAETVPQVSEPKETGDDGKTVPWPAYRAHRVSLVQTPAPETTGPVRYYTAVVSIATSNIGPLVVGEPSLLPATTPSASTTLEQLWPGAVSVQVTDPVQTAVSNWAKAFTSGDGAALKQTVGDPDQTHYYLSLPVFSLDKTEIRAATLRPGADVQDEKTLEAPDTLVARVSLSGMWPGSGNSDDNTARAALSYDVLVADASSGAPRVVAWAGVGCGLTLEPYQNWVTREIADAQDAADAQNSRADAGGETTLGGSAGNEPAGGNGGVKTPPADVSDGAQNPDVAHDEPDLGEDDPEKTYPAGGEPGRKNKQPAGKDPARDGGSGSGQNTRGGGAGARGHARVAGAGEEL